MTTDISTPRPAVSLPGGGYFSAFAEARVAAPPSAVYKALVDTSLIGKWNNFVSSVTIDKRPGSESEPHDAHMKKDMVMTFTVHMTPSLTTSSKELVTQVDDCPSDSTPGHITCIRWIMANKENFTPKFFLAAERVNEIEDLGDGTCIYRSWETFGGLAARIVKWKFGQSLQKNFEDWVTGLQKYVEEQQKQKAERENAVEMAA
ncbi:unnamed protein product [Aureobasidium mustum]|uniref:Bet v1-like protein n=1 Tax=Aureobasidium mustum TaxID=2773714 RepID=A0A9N8JFM3_9PEZI|nr:unnamed protein product [Aureobasidium mustum]